MRAPGQALSQRRNRPGPILLNGHAVRSVKITNPAGYFDVRVTFREAAPSSWPGPTPKAPPYTAAR